MEAETVGPIAARRARDAQLLAKGAAHAARDWEARDGAAPDGVVRDAPVADPALGAGSSAAANRPLTLLIPANTRQSVPLPAAEREAFLAHLQTVIADVYGATTAPHEPSATDAEQVAELPPVVAATCATCLGSCCTAGGTHAFVRADTIRRVRAQYQKDGATLSARSLVALYASHLPEQHYAESCVFHTKNACALPRSLRAGLCNRYQCGGLTQLTRALDSAEVESAYVVAADHERLQRVAHVSGSGARLVSMDA